MVFSKDKALLCSKDMFQESQGVIVLVSHFPPTQSKKLLNHAWGFMPQISKVCMIVNMIEVSSALSIEPDPY